MLCLLAIGYGTWLQMYQYHAITRFRTISGMITASEAIEVEYDYWKPSIQYRYNCEKQSYNSSQIYPSFLFFLKIP